MSAETKKISDNLNKAIAIPSEMGFVSEDGRQFIITAWRPCVEATKVVKVTVDFIVKLEDGKIAVS